MSDALYSRYLEITRRHSNGNAVEAPDGKLSFKELDDLSDRIGAWLSNSDTETCVLFMHPSCYYFASLVACMKTGKIAVPLEPEEKDNGLKRNRNQLTAFLCLTSSELISRAKKLFGSESCFVTDSITDNIQQLKQPDIQNPIEFPLHRVFTSGTTGSQKLITISRESVFVHVNEAAQIYRYRSGTAMANLGRHTSSNIINGFWRVMLSGSGFVCFDLKKENFAEIQSRVKDSGVSNLQGPSTVLGNFLLAVSDTADFSEIEHLIFGGEPLNPGLLKTVADHFNPRCLVTLNYSSTETMLISAYTSSITEMQNLNKIPVGVLVPSKKVRLLDEQGNDVNDGETGEVVVTSKYIALNVTADETEHMKVQEPDKPDLRTYFTGDVARWNKDGLLEHLGRKDNQIKINGVRIDTKLIENHLKKIKEIKMAAVVPAVISDGKKQLMACIVRDQKKIRDSEIIRNLSEELHTSHIPSYFVDTDQIPVNSRGKTDYAKLQDECRKFLDNHKHAVNLRNQELSEFETYLLSEWEKVLNKPVNKTVHSFFTAGGDSLAMNELVLEINSAFSLNLDSTWVFEYPTLEAQATYLESVLPGNRTELHSSVKKKDDLNKDEIKNLLNL